MGQTFPNSMHSSQNELETYKNQLYPGLDNQRWPVGWGKWFLPCAKLSWDFIWNIASSLCVPSTRQTWVCLDGSSGRLQIWLEGWNTSFVRIVIQHGEENSPGRSSSSFPGPKGAYKKYTFYQGLEYERGWGMPLHWTGVDLDRIERGHFTVRLVRHWNRVVTEVAEASSLDLLEVRLEGTLCSLT